LAALGHQVSVYLPRYRNTVDRSANGGAQRKPFRLTTSIDSLRSLSGGYKAGVRHYFVEYPPYFDRENAVLNCRGRLPGQRRALHHVLPRRARGIQDFGGTAHLPLHDWQSALVPVLLKSLYRVDPAFKK